MNRPGIFGWWLNGKVLRRRVLPRGQLFAFKFLLPLLEREREAPSGRGPVAARDRAETDSLIAAAPPPQRADHRRITISGVAASCRTTPRRVRIGARTRT